MSFKDQLNTDIQNIFFNTEEFGENHTVNGQTVKCITDKDCFSNTQKTATLIDETILFVAEGVLPYTPTPYTTLTLDGEAFEIQKVYNNIGVLEIVLERLLGKFEHAIIIEKATYKTNSRGFKETVWVKAHECLAYINNVSGDTGVDSSAVISTTKTYFKVAYTEGIEAKMRIKYANKVYDIKYVDNIEQRNEYLDIEAVVIS